MPRALLIVLVVAGCGSATRSSSLPRPTGAPAAPRSGLVQAEAWERGDGVRRDYSRAAAMYAELCQEGKGDLAACRRLLDAIGEARGAASERQRIIDLATAMCIDGGDAQACVYSMFFWFGHQVPSTPQSRAIERKLKEIDAEHFDERCEAGEPRACEAFLALDGMFVTGDRGGGAEAKSEAAHHVLCADGQLASCARVIDEVTRCGETADAEACVERVVDDWRQYDFSPALEALERVRRACDAGDARACAALPGRAIARTELCDARDFNACAELGCLGDAAAAAVAAANGVKADCDSFEEPEESNEPAAPAMTAPPRLVAGPPVPPIKPTDRLPFDSLRFRQLAIRDDSGWPRFEVYNLGKRRVVGVTVVFYAYDAAGKQLARSWPVSGGVRMLEPGASARLAADHLYSGGFQPGPAPGVTYEVCYPAISFARDSTAYRTRCPARKTRGARWGDGASRRVLEVSTLMPRGNEVARADDEHAYDERHIAAFEAAHPEVMLELSERWLDSRRSRRGYGHTDISVAESPEAESKTVQVPVTVTPVAVVYRLDGVDGLRLSPATLAKIVQGDLKVWNDRAIAADNPGVTLPAVAITFLRSSHGRYDPLGAYLAKVAPARVRRGPEPRGRSAHHVPVARALQVEETDGAIAQLELGVARARKLKVARIKNRSGVFVEPSAAGASAAAAGATVAADLSFEPIDSPGADAYPIAYVTYAVVRPSHVDTATWPWITAYLSYLLTDAQATLAQDHLGALPPALAARAVAAVQGLPPPPPQ